MQHYFGLAILWLAKLAYLENSTQLTLVFLRWSLVWIILLPFTYNEIIKIKILLKENLSLLFFSSVNKCRLVFNSFTYLSLVHTQSNKCLSIQHSNPCNHNSICFLFQIEKTNKFQISGLVISVLGILSIITRLNLNIIRSLNFNKGDLIMIGGIISWGYIQHI